MSTINFGLQAVVCERNRGSDALEERLRKCNSMASINTEFRHEPEVQEAITALQLLTKGVITNSLTRVHRNGEFLNVGPTAPAAECRH